MGLEPVAKRTLAAAAMEQLATYVRSGELRPGDPLPSQHDLAARLGVSRPVLREAMQGLAALGLIEIRPGSGCYVREPDPGEGQPLLHDAFTHEGALDVLEARMVIEVELAALAAERATAADLTAMEAALARIDHAAERGKPTAQETYDFHEALADAAHNRVLRRMFGMLRPPTLAGGRRVLHALPDIAAHEPVNHRRLYDAVRAGDPHHARDLMREHLEIAHGWEEQIAELRARSADPATTGEPR